MTHHADQDQYDDSEEFEYDPEQLVADFVTECGELGKLVLEAFDTTDPLGRHAETEAEGWQCYPDSYLTEARSFIEELKPYRDHVRHGEYREAEALIAELAWRSFDVLVAVRSRPALTRSLRDLAIRLHAAINLADHLPR
jgi:hypothetical protein